MKTNTNNNVQRKETEELTWLLRGIDTALLIQSERYAQAKDDECPDEEFTITIGCTQAKFICGGPQIQALNEFIQSIAAEQGYKVDYDKSVVTE